MDKLGLSKDQIEEILVVYGIVDGEPASATKLREAIAEVIDQNNKMLLGQIGQFLTSSDLVNIFKEAYRTSGNL